MGSAQSVPGKLFAAVRNSDHSQVQLLLQQVRRSSTPDVQRHAVFTWADPTTGMTCLMLAASRNAVEIMHLLLSEGADPHVMSSKTRGTALHEAVANKHESAVELLLQHRADPFLENAKGETPMDLAVVSGDFRLVRRLERCALFSGMVNQKVLQLRGFATANKDRWAVVMPRFLPPKSGQAVGVVRMMLWVYRDACGIEPRIKAWLDGASAFLVGPEDGVVRLHQNHEQPKNASTKYDRGWLLFFRPAAAAASPAGAREVFARFIDCCNRPIDYLAASNAAAAGSVGMQQQQQQQLPSQSLQQQPWGASVSAASGSPLWSPGTQHVAAYPTIPYTSNTGGFLVTPAALQGRPLQLRPADMPPSPGPFAPSPTLLAGAGGRNPLTPSAGDAGQRQQEFDPLVARPGESDAAFAQRLARMYGGFSASLDAHAPASGGSGSGAPELRPPSPERPVQVAQAAAATEALYPSAPPAATAGDDVSDEENMCIICLTNPRQIGFLHGSSVHRCVCKECAELVSTGGPCPLCRAPITAILNVY